MKRNRWYWILLTGLSILLVSSVAACVFAPSSAPTAQPPPTEQTEKKPAQFEISALTVKPSAVMVGDSATVTVTITNNGDISGTYTAPLLIDGKEIDRKDVTVAPASTREISFQVIKTTAGSYELMVGNLITKLTVCDWTPQTIQYDSGEYDAQMMGTCIWAQGWGHIVHFTPLAKPFKIQKISISAFATVDNFPDLSKRMFTVRIWNENSTQQLWSDDFTWSLFIGGGWKEINVPNIIADGDFHVEVVTNSDAPPSQNRMHINYEESKGELRSGASYMGRVSPIEQYAVKDKRWFIRVKGEGPPTTCVPENDRAEVGEEAASEPEAELTIPSPKLAFEDDFNDPDSGWKVESTKDSDCYYEDGEYHILIKNSNWASWHSAPSLGVLTDFILEADAKLVGGPKDGRYGLIFRFQNEDNFYLFLVSGNGYYLVGTRTNGQWTELRSWTSSEFVGEGYSKNHLKVICKGSQIQAYVNGHYLTTVTDEAFVTGRVGVIVDTIEPNAHVAFDNLKVYSAN
jgi:hypothetical protein